MTKTATEKLTKERIQQLLLAVGANSQEDQSDSIETEDYDWYQPHYFSIEQVQMLEAFANKVAAGCTEKFSQLYENDCKLSIISTKQRFLHDLKKQAEQIHYYISFGLDSKNSFGILSVPNEAALAWSGKVLHSTEDEADSTRLLSKLEESFLLDIASGLIQVFSECYGADLCQNTIVNDIEQVQLNGSEELFEITFEVQELDSEDGSKQASFIVCCDKFRSLVGSAESESKKLSDADIRNAVLKHIHQIPVSVQVELGTVKLPFKDVMSLEVDDVVVLDKAVTEPLDILVNNRVFLQAHPAQSEGKHALVII